MNQELKQSEKKGAKPGRKALRRKSRKALKTKIKQDPEFAKNYFDEKSKRALARKKAYKNRHKS